MSLNRPGDVREQYRDSSNLRARMSGPPAVERYEDALEVTEAEPVIDYIRSMSSFWNTGREELLAAMRGCVAAAIERDGVFRISKDAGLITARKR